MINSYRVKFKINGKIIDYLQSYKLESSLSFPDVVFSGIKLKRENNKFIFDKNRQIVEEKVEEKYKEFGFELIVKSIEVDNFECVTYHLVAVWKDEKWAEVFQDLIFLDGFFEE